ncbi:MAG TPA: exopolyphosphatase [Capsulimonadaceae bacterium]|jgi:nanoRNase/pAp phosphatase (c-di-AMP/oligoRNAs hydrolase)
MRLVTRSDFDGLICAVLLKQVEEIEEITFVHPKDLQDGSFSVTDDDILANVPYVPGCGLWFDHHSSEMIRVVDFLDFRGDCRPAPSAARVIYDYYGGKTAFGDITEMMEAVDKADSAQFDGEDILNPQGWVLLSFIMDPRTGLGRYRDYRISNYQLMYELIDACRTHGINDILKMTDVRERITRYHLQDVEFRNMLQKRTRLHGNVIVTDMRDIDPVPCGNRFMVYALWPNQNTSIWIVNGFRNQNCVIACGHSIINRTSQTDIGALMAEYGGGGHHGSGTCQVPHNQANTTIKDLVAQMNTDDCPVIAHTPLLKAA